MPDSALTPPPGTEELESQLDNAFTTAAESTAQASGEPVANTNPTPAPAPPPASPSPLFARAQQAGLKLDGVTDDAGLAQLVLDRYTQELPYAQHGRAYLANQPNQQSAGASDKQEEEAAVPDLFDVDGHFNSMWSAPAIDAQAKFYIENGAVILNPETGLYEAKPGFETMVLPVLPGLNQAHVAQKQQIHSLFEGNFYQNNWKAFSPAVEHLIQQKFQELIGGYETKQQTAAQAAQAESFVESFEKENAAWLFDNGQLTEKGQAFSQQVEELRGHGISDPQKLAALALKLIGGVPAATTETPAAPAANPAGERPRGPDGKFLPAAAAPPAQPPTKQESFLERAKRNAAASSNVSGAGAGGAEFVPANQGELDSLFTTAYAARTGAAA